MLPYVRIIICYTVRQCQRNSSLRFRSYAFLLKIKLDSVHSCHNNKRQNPIVPELNLNHGTLTRCFTLPTFCTIFVHRLALHFTRACCYKNSWSITFIDLTFLTYGIFSFTYCVTVLFFTLMFITMGKNNRVTCFPLLCILENYLPSTVKHVQKQELRRGRNGKTYDLFCRQDYSLSWGYICIQFQLYLLQSL